WGTAANGGALRLSHRRRPDSPASRGLRHGPGGMTENSEPSARSLDTLGRHAEHVYSVAEGRTPLPGIEEISSSWQRSANKYGVDPVDGLPPRIVTPGELKDLREPLDKLIFSAQEEVDQLYKVVREAGYAVLF